MAKNSIYDYSTTASSNTDIAGTGIQGTNSVNNFDDAFRTLMAQIAVDVSPRRMSIWGALYGLTLSNNAGDATNDIDVAVGMATTDSTTDPRTMVLATALTKRLDAAWAVGSGNGGWLDGASMPNGTGHAFMMQRSDTGVVDVGFSASTSPTLPTNYDRKRRIGSILRESAAIVSFKQNGDLFRRASKTDRTSTSALASSLLTLSIPAGIQTRPILVSTMSMAAGSSNWNNAIGSADNGAADVNFQQVATGTSGGVLDVTTVDGYVTSNTASQVYFAAVANVGTISANILNTIGWYDSRGRI